MTTKLIGRVLATDAGYRGFAPLALRIAAGIIFAAHGAQKLFGWFGGYGIDGTAKWMDSIGLSPGVLMTLLAGGAEFFGGIALLIGLLVRPAALVLAFAMAVATLAVHAGNGLFVTNNGYEFSLALFAIAVSLLVSGAGRWSVDALLARSGLDVRSATGWAKPARA